MVYTVKELSNILHIGRNTAYALMKTDGFPSYQINKQYFITDANLDNWLNSIIGKKFFVDISK